MTENETILTPLLYKLILYIICSLKREKLLQTGKFFSFMYQIIKNDTLSILCGLLNKL
jgi:hypothetical protein